jgi:predicted metal-dependent hydrolase
VLAIRAEDGYRYMGCRPCAIPQKDGPIMNSYDPRYLAGVLLFNAGDFFEAHEVWEDLWSESHGAERRFYQGLIQAAVGLCHFGNGNLRGAAKLYRSSRDYMSACGGRYLGLDVPAFWRQMEECFRPVLGPEEPERNARPDAALVPQIVLEPAPAHWPDPDEYLPDEDE